MTKCHQTEFGIKIEQCSICLTKNYITMLPTIAKRKNNLSLFDKLFEDTFYTPSYLNGSLISKGGVIQNREEGKTTLTVNVVGHNPEDVDVNVENQTVRISAIPREDASTFVEEVDLTYNVHPSTIPKPISAEIKNGLLTLVFEKAKESKKNKIKISY